MSEKSKYYGNNPQALVYSEKHSVKPFLSICETQESIRKLASKLKTMKHHQFDSPSNSGGFSGNVWSIENHMVTGRGYEE